MTMTKKKPLILLVDDTPENIDILVGLLQNEYDLSVAVDGQAALNAVRSIRPDLILLDVMMPEVSGYDVCRQLKADPKTREIPVIFLTALSAGTNEKEGLELGAVDYITKPFNPGLVEARIANQVALSQARRSLKAYGEHLEELVEQRTRQLAKAHQQLKAIDETKNQYLAAISHELRTPANGILGIGVLALDLLPEGDEKNELQQFFDEGTARLTGMLDSAMHLAQLQEGSAVLELGRFEVGDIAREVSVKFKETYPGVPLEVADKGGLAEWVSVDRQFMTESLETLLYAAVKLTGESAPVHLAGERSAEAVNLSITASGNEVSEELMKTIFQPFSPERSSSYVEELGLRLPLAENMIRAMGGKVAIRNIPGGAFEISVCLPVT